MCTRAASVLPGRALQLGLEGPRVGVGATICPPAGGPVAGSGQLARGCRVWCSQLLGSNRRLPGACLWELLGTEVCRAGCWVISPCQGRAPGEVQITPSGGQRSRAAGNFVLSELRLVLPLPRISRGMGRAFPCAVWFMGLVCGRCRAAAWAEVAAAVQPAHGFLSLQESYPAVPPIWSVESDDPNLAAILERLVEVRKGNTLVRRAL